MADPATEIAAIRDLGLPTDGGGRRSSAATSPPAGPDGMIAAEGVLPRQPPGGGVTGRPLVRVERRGPLGLLTMDRPEQRNPLDPESAAALRDALRAQFADDAVRAVAIAGEGDAFCAGGDLRQMGRFAAMPVEEALRLARRHHRPAPA